MGASLAQNMINHGLHRTYLSQTRKESGLSGRTITDFRYQRIHFEPGKAEKFSYDYAGKPVDNGDCVLPLLDRRYYYGRETLYKDTAVRCKECKARPPVYGIGISGGERRFMGRALWPATRPGAREKPYWRQLLPVIRKGLLQLYSGRRSGPLRQDGA